MHRGCAGARWYREQRTWSAERRAVWPSDQAPFILSVGRHGIWSTSPTPLAPDRGPHPATSMVATSAIITPKRRATALKDVGSRPMFLLGYAVAFAIKAYSAN